MVVARPRAAAGGVYRRAVALVAAFFAAGRAAGAFVEVEAAFFLGAAAAQVRLKPSASAAMDKTKFLSCTS